jgi:cytochrome c-type biogenesis protein
VSALPVSELGTPAARSVTLRASLLFVAGFTLVFAALGASFAIAGSILLRSAPLIVRAAGVGIIALGLAQIGVFHLPFLQRERRIDLARIPRGPASAFPLGMAFAFGWVPCIGPVLATILTAASATATVGWGAFLLACYSIGLGIPFMFLAIGFQRARGALEWLRRNGRRVEIIGGVMLVFVGALFVTGEWAGIFLPLQRSFARWGWPPV